MSVTKCPHCNKCYFPSKSDDEKCPFCGKKEIECPDFINDIFGGFNK